ncbi:MAG: hypothetical protein QOJ44_371 [Acidimicrobiaceae bacterium]|nr:hypothetical protein [Acidimicrobiaceae bacterium]
MRGASGRRPKRTWRRRLVVAVLVSLSIFLVLSGVSLGGALANPTLGTSVSARFAEWARAHGGGGIVTWTENVWYSHHQPPVGGTPPKGAIVLPHGQVASNTSGPPHLPAPSPIQPFANPPIPGEGQWSPAGRLVGGIPAVYETTLRPDPIHTSLVVGVAWMDTKLLHATLYSGSSVPGGGPYTHTAPVQAGPASTLVTAFNAGFRMQDANGGYYTDGRIVAPLRTGAASFVIYKDGSSTVGAWGQDGLTMTPNVVAVRQNLNLLVDAGKPVPGLNASDTTQWGATLGNQVYVWRSGVGVTATGALVYVGGPGLNITTLADMLVRAGAVRAMELDFNTDWVNLATYAPVAATGPASPANGTDLLPTMVGTPTRYFQPSWARDFITMSAATGP